MHCSCDHIIIFIVIFWICLLNSYANAAICRTPFGAFAVESPFKDCKVMLDFIAEYGFNLTSVQRKFLEGSFVNWEKRIVCCDPNFDPVRAFNSVGTEILRNQADICGDNTLLRRVAFGSESTFLAHPWSVLLFYNSQPKFQCGGTLITNRYVLTAGHCIKENLAGVRLGEHNIDLEIDCELDQMGEEHCLEPALDVNIEKVMKHPMFSAANFNNDIALLRLDKQIEFISSIKPICIPKYQNQVFQKEWGIISGWGATENSSYSNVHREALIPIISRDTCQLVHRRRSVDNTKLCTRGIEGEDTCEGDSGGPLYVRVEGSENNIVRKFRYTQVGVTSMGYHECGTKMNVPALYTNLAAYIDWIVFSIEM